MLKHNALKDLYARYYVLWSAFTQQKLSNEVKRLYTIPKVVPLKGKKDALAFVRLYFLKWRKYVRQTKQRKESNVRTLQHINQERKLVQYFFRWQNLVIQRTVGGSELLEIYQRELEDLQQVVLRTIDTLGGRDAKELKAREGETPEEGEARTRKMANSLRNLCEDMVVVLVLTSLWSPEGAEERVSESLEKLWREATQLKEEKEELLEEIQTLNEVIETSGETLRGYCEGEGTSQEREKDRGKDALPHPRKSFEEKRGSEGRVEPAEVLIDLCERVGEKLDEMGETKADEVERLKKAAIAAIELLDGKTEVEPTLMNVDDISSALNRVVAEASELEENGKPLTQALKELSAEHQKMKEQEAKQKERIDRLEDALLEMDELKNELQEREKDNLLDNKKAEKEMSEREKMINQLKKENDTLANQLQQSITALGEAAIKACETLGGPHCIKEDRRAPSPSGETPRNAERRIRGIVDTVNSVCRDVSNSLTAEERDLPLKAVIRNLKSQVDDGKRTQDRSTQRLEERTKERDGLRKELQNAQEKLRQCEKDLLEARRNLTAAETQAKKRQAEFEKVKAETEKEINDLRDAASSALTLLGGDANPSLPTSARRSASVRSGSPGQRSSPTPSESDIPRALKAVSSQVYESITDPGQSEPGPLSDRIRELKNKSTENEAKCDALSAQNEKLKEELSNYKKVIEYVTSLLKNPSVTSSDTEKKNHVEPLIEQFLSQGETTPSELTDLAKKISEESQSFLKSYKEEEPRKKPADSDPQEERFTSEVVREMRECAFARTAQLQEVSQQAVQLEALCVFLVNILRDGAGRLHCFMQPHVGEATEGAEQLWLDPEPNPVPPAGDASQYAEAILLHSNTPAAATLVHRHLKEGIVIGTHPEAPATWDVVAEYHHQLVQAVDLLSQYNHVLDTQGEKEAHLAAAQKAAQQVLGEHFPIQDEAQLCEAVQELADAVVGYRDSASHVLEALGEKTDQDANIKEMDKVLTQTLEESAKGVAEIHNEIRTITQQTNTPPHPLKESFSALKTKMREMEEERVQSEILMKGLDKAFNDDETLESSMSSFSSVATFSKSLKPKKKPLPAVDPTKESFTRLRHRNMPIRRANSMGPLESKISMMRIAARMKLEDVHELRLSARAALSVLDGTYKNEKPESYGEALVPLLLTQVEELKKLLPTVLETIHELKENKREKEEKPVPIGIALQTLINYTESLQLEKEGLLDQIENKNKLSKKLLDTSDSKEAKWDRRLQAVEEENKRLTEEREKLNLLVEELEKELEEEKDFKGQVEVAAENTQKQLEEAEKQLAEEKSKRGQLSAQGEVDRKEVEALTAINLQQQVQVNVLAEALASSLDDMNGEKSPARTESLIRQLLQDGDDSSLLEYVKQVSDEKNKRIQSVCQGQKATVQELRETLQHIKDSLLFTSQQELGSLFASVKEQAEDITAALEVENDMLRPRALDRERLLKENAKMKETLDHMTEEKANLQQKLETLEGNKMAFQQALLDQRMDKLLKTEEEIPKVKTPSAEDVNYATLLAEMEAKMIKGATALTVEAVDAITSENMSAVYGHVAEQTWELYRNVDACIQKLKETNERYPPNRLSNQKQFASTVNQLVGEMESLSLSAHHLWSSLPSLYRASGSF